MARNKVIIPLKTQASILALWKEILQYNLVSVIKGRVEEFWGESAAFNTPMAPNAALSMEPAHPCLKPGSDPTCFGPTQIQKNTVTGHCQATSVYKLTHEAFSKYCFYFLFPLSKSHDF